MAEQPRPNQPVDALLAQVRDLTTTPAQLQQIATHAPEHPELIAPLLAHPNIYPQLAQWLRGLQPEQDQQRGYLAGPAATGVAASAATTTGLAATQAGTGAVTAGGTDLAGQIASGAIPPIPSIDPVAHTATSAASIPPIHPTTATAAATKTATGLTAGKVVAGVATVAVVAGGGTAGYIALNNNATNTTTETLATAPAHASLSEDALLELLKTAPVTDFDRQLFTDNVGFLGTPEDAQLPEGATTFDDGAIWSPTETIDASSGTEGALGLYIDGYPRDEFSAGHERNTASAAWEIPPYVGDVNGDGANDIVTLT